MKGSARRRRAPGVNKTLGRKEEGGGGSVAGTRGKLFNEDVAQNEPKTSDTQHKTAPPPHGRRNATAAGRQFVAG